MLIRSLLAAAALLWAGAAQADEIDHLLSFPSEAAAQADPVVGNYYIPADSDGPGQWRGDVVFPGLTVSQNGTPLPGFFLIVSEVGTAPDAAIAGLSGCMLIADRDLALAGEPGFILANPGGLTSAQLASYTISPMPAGSNYPFGISSP